MLKALDLNQIGFLHGQWFAVGRIQGRKTQLSMNDVLPSLNVIEFERPTHRSFFHKNRKVHAQVTGLVFQEKWFIRTGCSRHFSLLQTRPFLPWLLDVKTLA